MQGVKPSVPPDDLARERRRFRRAGIVAVILGVGLVGALGGVGVLFRKVRKAELRAATSERAAAASQLLADGLRATVLAGRRRGGE